MTGEPQQCPECGAALERVTDGQIGDLVMQAAHPRGVPPALVLRRAPFYACPRCEFCAEDVPADDYAEGWDRASYRR